MGYRIETTETVQEALHRVAREQIDRALAEIDDADTGPHQTVHQVRKRCKKVRALARLVRTSFAGYSETNAAFRDAARRISDLRDAKVRVDSFDRLVSEHDDALDVSALRPIRRALVKRRESRVHGEVEAGQVLAEVRSDLVAIRGTVGEWELDDDSFDTVAGSFAKTYRRARNRMAEAYDEPSAERFHEWRKRAKYHRYQVRLLRPLWPTVMNAWRHSLHDLTDLLGDGNDLTELGRAGEPLDTAGDEARRVVLSLIERRRRDPWADARELGEMHFVDPAKTVVARLGAVWQSARF